MLICKPVLSYLLDTIEIRERMKMKEDAEELRNRYEKIATTLDYATTACDYNLRELEIELACEYLIDEYKTLDVGCGLGYAVVQYATRFSVEAYGIDSSANMIKGAKELLDKNKPCLRGTVNFEEASVLALPYQENYFDVVTSGRCLMALLDWDLQKKALKEIHRVLKPGGVLVLMEGTFEGLQRLNEVRKLFDLEEIPPDGRDRLFTLKFKEKELLNFCKSLFILERIQRFGMYYFLTRIVQPLLVAPEKPRYDHRINEVARKISEIFPDFKGLGHLVGFVFAKRH
jgi:ubiquinone/menaquinone biosynthesis C-methylase UbiE